MSFSFFFVLSPFRPSASLSHYQQILLSSTLSLIVYRQGSKLPFSFSSSTDKVHSRNNSHLIGFQTIAACSTVGNNAKSSGCGVGRSRYRSCWSDSRRQTKTQTRTFSLSPTLFLFRLLSFQRERASMRRQLTFIFTPSYQCIQLSIHYLTTSKKFVHNLDKVGYLQSRWFRRLLVDQFDPILVRIVLYPFHARTHQYKHSRRIERKQREANCKLTMKAMFYSSFTPLNPLSVLISQWEREFFIYLRTRILPSWGFFLNSTPSSSNLLHSSSKLSTETQMCPKLFRFTIPCISSSFMGWWQRESGEHWPSSGLFVTVCVSFEIGIRFGTPLHNGRDWK